MKKAYLIMNSKFRLVVVGTIVYKHDSEIDVLFSDIVSQLVDELPETSPFDYMLAFDEPLGKRVTQTMLN